MGYEYTQFSKNIARHRSISYAVNLLTVFRNEAPCVRRDYVRNIYNYYTQTEDDNNNKNEALKINHEHIVDWENLHDTCCGNKKPSDLTVCYLCGPEPNNDFDVMVSLGILPQNIWAFEDNKKTYFQALAVYKDKSYRQPRIIRQNIETFFAQTPKKFDIIYIDACGSIPSEQHALRCITSIFANHRLESPGIIISNFAEPDDKLSYIELLTQFFLSKRYPNEEIDINTGNYKAQIYFEIRKDIENNFDSYYSEFISLIIRDIPGIITPLQRFWKNPYLNQIIKNHNQLSACSTPSADSLKVATDSLAKFFISYDIRNNKGNQDSRINQFLTEMGDPAILLRAMKELQLLKNGMLDVTDDFKEIYTYFENPNKLHQFLDKPHSNILIDLIINQLAYPFHCNTSKVKRYKYCAKSTQMYTDINVYDECRYIYEWLPALHQITATFDNPSCQYIFRFALDGLVKSRINYNNEFFFQGAVIPNIEGFMYHEMADREII